MATVVFGASVLTASPPAVASPLSTASGLAAAPAVSGAKPPPWWRKCRTVNTAVTLPNGDPAGISGEYCTPALTRPATLQVLVHGGSYNHDYWTWSQQPGTYNYLDKAVSAGYAVLAIDRLGDGTSTRPPSAVDTAQAQVSTLGQVIEAVRGGSLGPRYDRIEYVGHSFGSYYGVALVAQHPGLVDTLLLTGFGVRVSAATVALSAADSVPASYLPRFAGLDPGYLTNRPGTRADHLYYLPDADPAVIAYDERTEDTLNTTEVTTRPVSIASLTAALPVTLPILLIDGNHDLHYCTGDTYDCSSATTWFGQEASTFPSGACVAGALEESGHDLQLHRSAPVTDRLMLAWSRQVIGPDEQAAPRCAVTGPIASPGIPY